MEDSSRFSARNPQGDYLLIFHFVNYFFSVNLSSGELSVFQNTSLESYINDRNLFHLLPLNAQQIFVQQLMATAAVLAKQQEDKSTTVKRTRLEEEITKSTSKQNEYNKSEWNQEKNDKE